MIASIVKKIRVYMPLISMIILAIGFTMLMYVLRGYFYGYYSMRMSLVMHYLMGSLLIVFAAVKMIRWEGFVTAFRKYDLLAQYSKVYAYVYPLIELSLGISYLVSETIPMLFLTYVFTIVLSFINAASVIKELQKKKPSSCACLGVVFSLPMTWVSLFENIFTALMASALLYDMVYVLLMYAHRL